MATTFLLTARGGAITPVTEGPAKEINHTTKEIQKQLKKLEESGSGVINDDVFKSLLQKAHRALEEGRFEELDEILLKIQKQEDAAAEKILKVQQKNARSRAKLREILAPRVGTKK